MSLFDVLTEDEKKKIKKQAFPRWIPPMLATLTDKRFSDPNWIYERKFDGERCIAYKNGSKIHLMTRNEHSLNAIYPVIARLLEKQAAKQFIIDGEVVAFEGTETSFKKLQQLMHVKKVEDIHAVNTAVFYYVFDILYVDGYRITSLPLIARKKILEPLLSYSKHVVFTEFTPEKGVQMYTKACKKGWEGVIAKDAFGIYESKRSKNWLKFKCVKGQELVIGGYTNPSGSRVGFGALLLGYYKGNKLYYAGKVGTGFSDEFLALLTKKMKKLKQEKPAFVNYDDSYKNVNFIKPVLVGQVKFSEWTKDNKLRHPSFEGMRDDKAAKDVVKED